MNHKEAVDYVKRELIIGLRSWAEIDGWLEGKNLVWKTGGRSLDPIPIDIFDDVIASIAKRCRITAIRFVRTAYDCDLPSGRAIVDALLAQSVSKKDTASSHAAAITYLKGDSLTKFELKEIKSWLSGWNAGSMPIAKFDETVVTTAKRQSRTAAVALVMATYDCSQISGRAITDALIAQSQSAEAPDVVDKGKCICTWKPCSMRGFPYLLEHRPDCPVHGKVPQKKTHTFPGFRKKSHQVEQLHRISMKEGTPGLLSVMTVDQLILNIEAGAIEISLKTFREHLDKMQKDKEKRACGFCVHNHSCLSMDRAVKAMKFIPASYGVVAKQTSSGRPVLEALAAFCPMFKREED